MFFNAISQAQMLSVNYSGSTQYRILSHLAARHQYKAQVIYLILLLL